MENASTIGETSATQESSLTPEDEERLSQLFYEIGEDSLYFFGSPTPEEKALAERLKREDTKAVEYILREINDKSDVDSYLLYTRVCQLKHCASPETAERVCALLLDGRIMRDADRSSKIVLFEIIANIAGIAQLESLKKYAEQLSVLTVNDVNLDTGDISNAIAHISLRTNNQSEIEEAWNFLQDIRLSAGLERIDLNERVDYVRTPEAESIVDNAREYDPYADDEAEDFLQGEFIGKRKFLNGVERLEIVKRLREKVRENRGESKADEEPEEPDDFLRKHFLEYRETKPSPLGITMGIEIEIPKKSVLPPEAKKWTETEKGIFLDKRKGDFYETESLGVPPGYDLFYEFAHRPANYPLTIAREVQALMHMGLIDAKYTRYPLHVTLGHIEGGRESYLLLRALEATGWSTNKDRLLRPYRTKFGSWTRKGDGGIVERNPYDDEIEGGIQDAIEMRTLQLQSITGLDRMLHSVYYLGAALSAFQEGSGAWSATFGSKKQALANLWEEFSSQIESIFQSRDLDSPSERWYINPSDKEEFTPFTPFADTLDKGVSDAKKKIESPEASFVRDIRALIIKTRAEAKRILNEARQEFEDGELGGEMEERKAA